MGADSSIYSLIRPIQAQDPLEQAGRAMTLQNLMGQQELHGLQTQQARQGMADKQTVRDAYKNARGDPVLLERLLNEGGAYEAVNDLKKNQRENIKADADLQKKDIENFVALTAQRLKDRQTIRTPEEYAAHRDQAIQSAGMFKTPELRKVALSSAMSMPEQFDPQWVARSIVDGKELFTPKIQTVTNPDGSTENIDTNIFTNPSARNRKMAPGMTPTQKATTDTARGQLAVSQDNAAETRAEHGRVAARAEQARADGRWTNDLDRGLQVNAATGETRPITRGGAPIGPREKLTDTQKNELASIDSQTAQIKGAIKVVAESPDAFSFSRGSATMAGAIPESVAGRFDTDEQRKARSYVFNVVSKVINERAGAAQSAQELARLRSFLPGELDRADQITSKLEGFLEYLKDSRAGYDKPQVPVTQGAPQPAATAAPKTFKDLPDPAQYKGKRMEADNGTIYKSDGKKWMRE